MARKHTLDLGHVRFGQEVNMADEVVEVKSVCWKLVDQSIKTSHGGQELWVSYVKKVTFHQTALKKKSYTALEGS